MTTVPSPSRSPEQVISPTTRPKPPPWESSGLYLPIEAPAEVLKDAFFKALRGLKLNSTSEVFRVEVPPIEYSKEEIMWILGYCYNLSSIRPVEINLISSR